MSWWIYLEDENGNTIDTDILHSEGGTYQFGGTTSAELNVTYNYSKHFDFKLLNELAAGDAVKTLKDIANKLKDDVDENYWNATEGNVKNAITTLLDFAKYAIRKNIKAKFRVS